MECAVVYDDGVKSGIIHKKHIRTSAYIYDGTIYRGDDGTITIYG